MELVAICVVGFVILVIAGSIIRNKEIKLERAKINKQIAEGQRRRNEMLNRARNGQMLHPHEWNSLSSYERRDVRAFRKWNKRKGKKW